MTNEELKRELDELRALFQRQPQSVQQSGSLPGWLGYWFAEVLYDDTATGTSDYSSTFDDTTNPRTISYIVTAGGWLPPQIVGGDDHIARFRIAFWNDGPPYQVPVTLQADTLGNFQSKINGLFTNHGANLETTWQFRTGPNEVCIMIGDGAERLTMSGRLFDGVLSKWMDVDWASGFNR